MLRPALLAALHDVNIEQKTDECRFSGPRKLDSVVHREVGVAARVVRRARLANIPRQNQC